MKPVEVVTVAAADQRFGIRALFDLDGTEDDEEIVVLPGDSRLDNLPLDFRVLDTWAGLPQGHPNALAGVVVQGTLTVDDWIMNWEGDFGPFLLVCGDLRAKNVATAGSQVLVTGNVEVAQTLAGIYNHGHTVIQGDTRAQVILTCEHLIMFHGAVTADFAWAGNFFSVADPAKLHLRGRVGAVFGPGEKVLTDLGSPVENRSLRLVDPQFQAFAVAPVLAAMEAGRSLLRGPRPAPPELEDAMSGVERIRVVLLRAGCREGELWEDGFGVRDEHDGPPYALWFSESESDERDLDRGVELRRYIAALRVAGYRVEPDPDDEDLLLVR